MTTENFRNLDDDAFEASLIDDEIEEGATTEDDTTATTPGDEETPAEEETPEGEEGTGETDAETEGDDEFNPDGPGDPKKWALAERAKRKAEAEARKAAEERAAAAEARLAQIEAAEAAAKAQAEEAQIQAQYQALVDEGREDEAREYLLRVQQHKTATLQTQHQQQLSMQALKMSAAMVKEIHPDFDERIGRLYQALGPAVVDQMALQNNPAAPAKWAYEFSRTHFPTEADTAARVEEAAKAKLAEIQAKNQPPAQRGHKSIAHVSSGTQNPGVTKPVRRMSDAELERSLYE